MADKSGAAELTDLSEMTDTSALLAELADVQVPSVSAWPAPGWWVLACFLVTVGCLVGFLRHHRKKQAQNAWRKQALQELSTLQRAVADASDFERHELVRQSSSLLRRVMLHVNGRAATAALTDAAWLDTLLRYNRNQPLDESLHPLLTSVPYEPAVSDQLSKDDVHSLLHWMKGYINNLPQVNNRSTRQQVAAPQDTSQ